MPPYGIALAADALSRAISGSFKGASEGHEERRKEEEAGRQARAAMTEEAYQPIRFRQGQLANQQTEQAIQHAASQEGRAQAQEQRTAQRYPLEQRLLTANVETAEVEAKTIAAKTKLAMDESQARLDLVNEQLKEARVRYDWLVPQLEEEQRNRNQDYLFKRTQNDKALFDLRETEKAKAAQNRISAKMLAAGSDLAKAWEVISDPDARYLDPNDPYIRMHLQAMEAQARTQGLVNPYQTHVQRETSRRAAINDAQQEAKRMMQLVDKRKAKYGGEGADEMEGWLYKYHLARYLRVAENPAIGVVYSDADKHIPSMPKALIDALVDTPWSFDSQILNSESGKEFKKQVYYRMNTYLVQGMDWATAGQRAHQDIVKSKQGVPTASDEEAGKIPVEDSWGGLFSLFRGKPEAPKAVTKPDIPLPPAVPGRGTKEELTQSRLDAIVAKHPKLGGRGLTWDDLLAPGNEKWKKYVEDVYEETHGSKP